MHLFIVCLKARVEERKIVCLAPKKGIYKKLFDANIKMHSQNKCITNFSSFKFELFESTSSFGYLV